jgi:hypothetical protein
VEFTVSGVAKRVLQVRLFTRRKLNADHGCRVRLAESELHTVRDQTPTNGF